VLKGAIEVNGTPLTASDAAAVGGERELVIHSPTGAEIMLCDLA
jgi:redox-sensitive bicupin YhaK (pirin superfamily)